MMRRHIFAMLCSTLAAPAIAVEQVSFPPIAGARDITASKVGPSAGGFAPAEVENTGQGLEIRANKVPAFARVINHREIYDGAAVGGPHLLIESVKIHSALDIYTPLPVVIRGAEISVAGGPWALHMRPGSGPLYVSWSRIGGSAEGEAKQQVQTAIIIRGSPARIYRSHLSIAGDAIHADAPHVLIAENLIDGLVSFKDSHNDAIQIAPGVEDVVIRRNHILNQNPQTSCIFNEGSKVKIEDNYLAGGGWVIYGGAASNGHRKDGVGSTGVRVAGNVFGADFFPKSGNFGPLAYWSQGADGANIWRDNHFADGRSVEAPPSVQPAKP